MARDGYDGGKVYVDVEPEDAALAKFERKLAQKLEPQGDKLGKIIGKRISEQIAASINAGLSDSLGKGSDRPAREGGKRAGEAYSGEFDRTVRSKIQAALRSLPPIKIGAATTEAEQKLRDLQGQLKELSGKEIGVEIESATALAEVDRIQRELTQLSTESPDVQVRADTAAASAKLAAISTEVSKLDGKSVDVDVDADTGAAVAQMAALNGASGASHAGMNALIVAGASLGPMIAPAAAVAVAGIGAIGPAALAAAGGIGVLALGFSGVIGAVQAMVQAEGKAGSSASSLASQQAKLANTADQVKNAQDALRGAEDSLRNSQDSLRNAQDAVRMAQERATTAQQALTDARRAAKAADEDLASQVANNALAQRTAALNLEEAREKLSQTQLPGTATERQLTEAQLAYDRAQQQVADLGVQHDRLAEQQRRSAAAGIEGSEQVVAAKAAIVDADRDVAQAEQRYEQATRGVVAAQRQLEQATRGVAAAQRAGEAAAVGAAGGVDKVAQAMAGLSPAGQQFALFMYGLKPAFEQLRGAAETALLPGVEAGIRALLPILPSVSANISILAGVMGELFAEAGKALASPFWVDFFNQMTAVAVPILRIMAPTLLNVAKGFAGIMLAFAPLAPMIGKYLLDLSQRFADFGASLSSNPAFQEFVDYVIRNAPTLMGLLGNLGVVAIKLLIAFAPLGEILLNATAALFGWLATLDPGVLAAIAGMLLAIAAAISVAIVGPLGSIGLIVAAVVALVGTIVYAWKNFEGFRDVVTLVWKAIKAIVVGVWDYVLKPIFDGIAFIIVQVVAPAFMFLWQNAISPVMTAIQISFNVTWAVLQVVFGLIQIAIKLLGEVFVWLWKQALEPVWLNGIRPIFVAFGDLISSYVVPAFRAGVSAIASAWNGIRDAAKIPVRFVIDTVLNNGLLAGYNKLAKLFNVKPDNVRVALPAGFATGGLIRGPGSGTSDSILAQVAGGPMIRVSNGEYIIPEDAVRRYGVGFFDAIAGKPNTRFPGDGSEGLAFAGGGLLDFGRDLWDAVSNPTKLVAGPINALINRIPGGAWARDVAGGAASKALGGLLAWVKSAGGDGSNVGKTRAFLQAQRGKPYVWASAGPGGYDCSGLVSAAWNVMHGRSPYSHTFSTHNQAGFFPKRGHGIFTAGWANAGERGGGSVGHTAGLLAGMGFESRGGDGVVIGNGTTSVNSFAHVGTFDQGGYLPPGLTLAYNGTGQPEAVFTDGQLSDLKRGLGGQTSAGGKGSPLIGEINLYGSQMTAAEQVHAIGSRVSWVARTGTGR